MANFMTVYKFTDSPAYNEFNAVYTPYLKEASIYWENLPAYHPGQFDYQGSYYRPKDVGNLAHNKAWKPMGYAMFNHFIDYITIEKQLPFDSYTDSSGVLITENYKGRADILFYLELDKKGTIIREFLNRELEVQRALDQKDRTWSDDIIEVVEFSKEYQQINNDYTTVNDFVALMEEQYGDLKDFNIEDFDIDHFDGEQLYETLQYLIEKILTKPGYHVNSENLPKRRILWNTLYGRYDPIIIALLYKCLEDLGFDRNLFNYRIITVEQFGKIWLLDQHWLEKFKEVSRLYNEATLPRIEANRERAKLAFKTLENFWSLFLTDKQKRFLPDKLF